MATEGPEVEQEQHPGQVTSIGWRAGRGENASGSALAGEPRAPGSTTPRRCICEQPQQSVESRFLRSAIQATDSSVIGCTARTAATRALGQRACWRGQNRYRSTTLVAWRADVDDVVHGRVEAEELAVSMWKAR